MYKILKIKDKVKVPPSKFGMPLKEAVKSSLEDKWEGLVEKGMGVILAAVSVGEIGEGKILPGDGSIHYPSEFELLVYTPEMHDIVRGYVIDVTEFGVFIRMGPVDGMIHVSQIMDDFVTYDPKNAVFTGRESNNTLKEKDIVRARIISISMEKQYKIGLTTRQKGLGAESWIEKAKKGKGKKKSKSKKKGKK